MRGGEKSRLRSEAFYRSKRLRKGPFYVSRSIIAVSKAPAETGRSRAIGTSVRDRLEASASFIFGLGRRRTEQTFELGDHPDKAAWLLEDGIFDK